jgi:hypothetical protein
MAKLEDLFEMGHVSSKVEVKGVHFTVNLLNVKMFQDACNASESTDPTAQNLEYKQQILARSISFINDRQYIEDVDSPKPAEISSLLEILKKLHFSILNKIYEAYDKLELDFVKETENTEKIKK